MGISGEDFGRLCALSRDVMYVASMDGKLLAVNIEFERLLGWSGAEIPGRHLDEFIDAADRSAFAEALGKAAANTPFLIEARWRTRDNRRRLILWKVLVTESHIYAAGQDVTQQRAAEEALRHTAAQLQLMTDNLPALVSYLDADGRYVQVNETYADWLGRPAADLPGLRAEDVLTETFGRSYWEQVRPGFERALHGEAVRVEAEGMYPNGFRYVEIHYQPDRDPAGRVRGITALVVDVTRRKLIEEDLGFRAELLESALEPIFAWILNLSNAGRPGLGEQIIYWNPMAETLYGFTRDEAIGQLPHDLLKTRLPWPAEEFDRRLAEAGEWSGELVHTTKDGRLLFVESRLRVIRMANRTVVVECIRDITARRTAELELRASESLFRSLVETVPIGIFRAGPHGNATFANRQLLQLWQQSEAEFLGDGWLSRIHPDDLDVARSGILAMDSCDCASRLRYRLLLPTGEIRSVDVTAAPVNVSDPALGNIGVVEDITDQLRHADALRESEEKYRYTVELSRQIAWTAAPDGRIEQFSPRGYELTGLTEEESIGEGWAQLLHPDDKQPTAAAWQKALESGPAYDVEHRIRMKDGEYRWMRSRGYARRDAQGAIVRWYGTTEDIHDRKHSELLLAELNRDLEQRVQMRTRELAEINKELETFSYSVSHDLRAPLRAIDGFGRMLVEDESSRLSDSGVRSVQRIRANTQRMGQLIDDILELSRVSRQPVEIRRVNLSAMAQSVIEELRRDDPQRMVGVTIEPGMYADGDARLLRIALENLLGNAWKYTSRKAEASIEFARDPDGASPAWVVRDNGAGFDSAYAHQLFAPFQRLHRESEFPGTGIGLATVARIIHRHGGRVWAEGEKDKGAAFHFTLWTERLQMVA